MPHSCVLKYVRRPSKNGFSPTHATSCFRTDAPFAYVMPSKLRCVASTSGMSATIGCVVGSWSWRYAHVFSSLANVTHESMKRVARSFARYDTYVAKLSFSHRSFHHFIVTRSPNHMCDISWRITSARCSRAASVTFERKIIRSLYVTQPRFSIAPNLYSGQKTWS